MIEGLKPGQTFSLTSRVSATCPCGGSVMVAEALGEQCLLHTEPPCDEFVRMEIQDFLFWLNAKLGNHRKDGVQ